MSAALVGEAKRRAAASPHTRTTAGQVLRKITAQLAALPPAPMNGANVIEMSPGDFSRICASTEVSPFDGRTLSGLRVLKNDKLPDGAFIGRRNGKAVWSNNAMAQAAIDAEAERCAEIRTTVEERC